MMNPAACARWLTPTLEPHCWQLEQSARAAVSGELLLHVEAYDGETSTKANDANATKQRVALVAITALGTVDVAEFPEENALRLQALFNHPSTEVR